MKTAQGWTVTISARNDAIRITFRGQDGKSKMGVFTIPEIEALERKLKAKRGMIARKHARGK